MSNTIFTKNYSLGEVNRRDVLRYAKGSIEDSHTVELLEKCLAESAKYINCKVCYKLLDLEICDNICDFGEFSVVSSDLAKNLSGCRRVVLFGATLGANFDRLIIKYSKISPSKAVMLQAIGAERVEALCDQFCEDISFQYGLSAKVRFSAGYGDLPLEIQKDIFISLALEKNIGLTLNDGFLMTPTKSVTAFMGLYK